MRTKEESGAVPDGGDDLVQQAISYLRPRLPFAPRVGVILGSGWGAYAERAPLAFAEAYEDIPGMPPCSIQGHAGRLALTDRCGPPVALLQGRIHRYEGYSLEAVTRAVRVLAALGVDTLVLTCAAGGLGDIPVGDVMVVEDHLNLMGDNPLVGRDLPGAVPRFVEMAEAYDPGLIGAAEEVAHINDTRVHRGVLACVAGPTYETRAEAAMLRKLGAHAVTMSTVPEVIVARALQLRVLALALITNQAGASPEGSRGHQGVLAVSEGQEGMIGRFLDALMKRLAIGFEEILE